MAIINPYLNFNGNTEEVFNFYRSVFGGEFVMLQRMKDVPGMDNLPEAEKDKLMHVSLPVGKSILMGTDVPGSMPPAVNGTSVSLCISTGSREENEAWFHALAAGGTVQMPLEDMFWGDYFGMVTDRFGIQWMLSFNPNQPA
jgi:PhnB protein